MPRKTKASQRAKKGPVKKGTATPALPRSVRAFIDETGGFIEHWGFKRVQGEIWGLVFLKNRPVTATEIASQLKVSKALVSLAMAELLEYRVLLPVGGEDGRAQRLIPNENLGEVIGGVLRLRESKILQQTSLALDSIKSLSAPELSRLELSPDRLNQLKVLVEQAQQVLVTILMALGQTSTEK